MEPAKSLYLLRFEDVGDDEELVKLSLSTPALPSSSTSGHHEPQPPCSLPSSSSNCHNLDSFPSNNPSSSNSFGGAGHEKLLDIELSLGLPGSSSSSSSASGDRHKPQLPCSSLPASSTSINHRNLDPFPSNNPSSGKRLFSFSSDGDNEEYHEGQRLDHSFSLRSPWLSSLDKRSSSSLSPPSLSPSPSPSPSPNPIRQVVGTGSSSTRYQRQVRRNPFQTPKGGKSETIAAPYPWATTRRATVHDLNYLRSQGITMIAGDVECKGCQQTYKIEYNLEDKFNVIKNFISANKLAMHHRAPELWMNPKLDNCENCGNVLKPVTRKKREINWLFLLLGVLLGCCKLSELKYFCKHSKNHRTGAKNRLLYYTFLGLCKQLDPEGPFDID